MDSVQQNLELRKANIFKMFGGETANNDLIKGGGEGSRGGKIIGHTSSGKPIYANSSATGQHEKFNKQDHIDASDAHRKAMEDNKSEGHKVHYHMAHRDSHKDLAKKEESEDKKDNVDIASDISGLGIKGVEHHGNSVSIPKSEMTKENVEKINAYMDKSGHKPKITKFDDAVNLQF